MIDNAGDIDYEQLYAQVLYEIRELNAPYWFNNQEIIRNEYPHVTISTKAKVELGRALVSLDYERKEHSHVAYYKAVPLKAA